MKFRVVILTHGGGEAASRHRGRATGGPPLGHLDHINAGLGALKRGHGSGGAATDNQNISFVSYDRNVEPHWVALLFDLRCVRWRRS
jgi:hypothetical protein